MDSLFTTVDFLTDDPNPQRFESEVSAHTSACAFASLPKMI